MTISVFDLFRIGIGPSSSHTVGPMRAARLFLQRVQEQQQLADVGGVIAHLYGSLAATGVGHGTVSAVVLGLAGAEPSTLDPDEVPVLLAAVEGTGTLHLLGKTPVPFHAHSAIVMHPGPPAAFSSLTASA